MAKFIEVEAWVIVDGDENYVVSHDEESAAEKYGEDVGDAHATPRRTIKVKLTVPVPEVVELEAIIPEEAGGTELRVA
jgi:hypothetical protein